MLNDSIRKKIRDYCYDRNFGCDDDEDTIETIRDAGKIVRKRLIKKGNGFHEYRIIKDFDGLLLEYTDIKIELHKVKDCDFTIDIKEMIENKFFKLIKGYREKKA